MQKKLDSGTCQKHSKTIMNIAKITKQKNEVLISATKLKGGSIFFDTFLEMPEKVDAAHCQTL
jgi:hypothetical protein